MSDELRSACQNGRLWEVHVTGRTESEQFRHECEVRWVAKLPDHDSRRRFLAEVEKHRGKVAAERLRSDVMVLMGYGLPRNRARKP